MLYSTNNSAESRRPVFAAWFGNFFEPYFSDCDAVDKGLKDLRDLGINSIVLDSKLWSDFTRYFQTGEASQYVKMQLFIRDKCREYGLGMSFLALFANGDNLYPHIYEHPPEYVDQPVDAFGNVYRGYRHWSKKQTDEHVRHCLDLYRFIAADCATTATDEMGCERLPFYFYHSPIFAPAFDEEGRMYYLHWLESQYSIGEVNSRYGTSFSSIREMNSSDYWVNPDEENEALRYVPGEADYRNKTGVILKHADNQKFKRWVMRSYFEEITGRLKENRPQFYLYPALSQWKIFFNDFVHIQNRGWDLWELGKTLDSPTFITLPVDSHGEIQPDVVPCELAMLRSAAEDKDYVAGLFLGRYMATDIYAACSPSEVIASAFGAGATELYFYGYNGLDDGGNFAKWGPEPRKSLKEGLDWFASAREMSGKRIKAHEVAILFPFASYTLAAAATDWSEYTGFRTDLLGWFRQFTDHGINPDILHPSQVRAGQLQPYKIIVIPADPLYWAMPDPELEREIRSFVENGGALLHSVSALVQNTFGIAATPHKPDSFQWEEAVVTDSGEFVSYEGGKVEARYFGDGKPAYISNQCHSGTIHSFGFHYGYAYACKEHLPVAKEYKKQNHYPLPVLARTPADKILADLMVSKGRHRGIERVAFANGKLIVNHTPYSFQIEQPAAHCLSTFEGFDGRNLPGHHAAFSNWD